MKNFTHTITDENGVHLRPAALLVSEASKYDSKITIISGERKVPADSLIVLITLGIKCGQTITVEIEGSDEEKALKGMKNLLKKHL